MISSPSYYKLILHKLILLTLINLNFDDYYKYFLFIFLFQKKNNK